MSYRSLTRLLGETRLESKCRVLFLGSMLILISGAFLLVNRITTNLVMTNTQSKGRDMVDILIIKSHFERWQTDEKYEKYLEMLKAMGSDFEKNQNYRYEVLTLPDQSFLLSFDAKMAADGAEEAILLDLKREKKMQDDEIAQARAAVAEQAENGSPIDLDESSSQSPEELLESLLAAPPIFKDRPLPEIQEYHYYEPIYLESTCKTCHLNPLAGVQPAAEMGGDSPFYAVKVMLPYEETQKAIHQARSVLIAVGILTVTFAMIVLYAVVRYVIVRPLKHLRDVSDKISHGATELRADIQTHDEFEELAASFNRMLRHMTDAQSELRDVNSDLDGKVDELAQLNMRLHEMNRLKSDFLANMSHELRTPLNSIIGFSEVLSGIDSLDEKQNRYVENIQKSGRLLLEMINDILDLAKMEAGKMDVRPTEFHADAVVGAQCDMVRALTEEKNIDLKVLVPKHETPLYQDQTKLQQILTNLLSNAIKFTPEGGRVTVEAGKDDRGRFRLTVSDTGVGIAEVDREIIFEKFRQSTTSLGSDSLTREFSGTGLGLSIVKELCKLMGGEVDFESDLGKGSAFTVLLPWVISDPSRRSADLNANLDDATKSRSSLASAWKNPKAPSPAALSGPHSQR